MTGTSKGKVFFFFLSKEDGKMFILIHIEELGTLVLLWTPVDVTLTLKGWMERKDTRPITSRYFTVLISLFCADRKSKCWCSQTGGCPLSAARGPAKQPDTVR